MSKVTLGFKKTCRKAKTKGKKLHCPRDTFAVRRYLRTRDIYRVAKELGHSSITTTEIYTKFNVRRLEEDFPDLAKGYQDRERPQEITLADTGSPDTQGVQMSPSHQGEAIFRRPA